MSDEIGIEGSEPERRPQWFFFPSTGHSCSQEFAMFVRDFHGCVEYFTYMGNLANAADRVKRIAREALRKPGEEQVSEENEASAIKKYERFGSLSVRHITNVTVDAFLWYISNISQRVLIKKPQMLKTKEQVRIDEIVDFTTKRDLVKFLVDRRVSRLAYGGLQEIENYLGETFGIALFSDATQRAQARFFVEVRNINVHNRSRANSIFLARTSGDRAIDCIEGEQVTLGLKIFDLCEALIRSAMDFDTECCSKFRISKKSLSAHINNKEILKEMDVHHLMHLRAELSNL